MFYDSKKLVHKVLNKAGISINGSRPYDIQVHNDHFYNRVIYGGEVAFGESYMDGWWDCYSLDAFFEKIFQTDFSASFKNTAMLILRKLQGKFFNLQKQQRAYQVGIQHYDLGNEFYKAMLESDSFIAAHTGRKHLILKVRRRRNWT